MKKETSKTILIIGNIIFASLIVIGSPAIIMSPMMFDAPGSENSIPLNILFYSLWTYTPATILAIALSITTYKLKKHSLAAILVFIPTINLLGIIAGFLSQFIIT